MRFWRAQLVLLVAVLLAPLGSGFAQPRYFCHMLDRVVSSCCCDAERGRESSGCEVRAASGDCCERIAPLANSPPGHPASEAAGSMPPALLAIVLPQPDYGFARGSVESVRVRRARGPPPGVRPPLFIAKCALLI
jgi:hypothetical protein